MALKNAVYVLPRLEDCLEDFEWIGQEAIAGGGEAYVCEADFLEAGTNAVLIRALPAGSRRRLCGACRVHPPVEPEGKTPERRESPGGRSAVAPDPFPQALRRDCADRLLPGEGA